MVIFSQDSETNHTKIRKEATAYRIDGIEVRPEFVGLTGEHMLNSSNLRRLMG
jgi:hypothetical protein